MSSAPELHLESRPADEPAVNHHEPLIPIEIDNNNPSDTIDAANDNGKDMHNTADKSFDIIETAHDGHVATEADKSCKTIASANVDAQIMSGNDDDKIVGADIDTAKSSETIDAANDDDQVNPVDQTDHIAAEEPNISESSENMQSISDSVSAANTIEPTQTVNYHQVTEPTPAPEAATINEVNDLQPIPSTEIAMVDDIQSDQNTKVDEITAIEPVQVPEEAEHSPLNDQAHDDADNGRVLGPSRRRYKDYVSVKDRRKVFGGQ